MKVWTTWAFATGTGSDPTQWSAGPGAYLLVIRLTEPFLFSSGKFAQSRLAKGLYAYAGSARGPGGLRARVARHCQLEKNPRWHIDHLTSQTGVNAVAVFEAAQQAVSECSLAEALVHAGAKVPLEGFGSSDCRTCRSHFLQLPPSMGAEWL